MPEVKFQIKHKGTDDSKAWEEVMDVPTGQNPREFALAMVERFNNEEDYRQKIREGYPAMHRELVSVEGETGISHCNFSHKANAMTIVEGNALYDVWQCENCKIYHQRMGISDLPTRRICNPELTCRKCNRTFKNAKVFQKHMDKNKHKQPSWLTHEVSVIG